MNLYRWSIYVGIIHSHQDTNDNYVNVDEFWASQSVSQPVNQSLTCVKTFNWRGQINFSHALVLKFIFWEGHKSWKNIQILFEIT